MFLETDGPELDQSGGWVDENREDGFAVFDRQPDSWLVCEHGVVQEVRGGGVAGVAEVDGEVGTSKSKTLMPASSIARILFRAA